MNIIACSLVYHIPLLIFALINFTYLGNLNVDIALGKPTGVSSKYFKKPDYSSFSFDGITSGDMEISGSAHCGPTWWEQWWMVDLQMTHLIHRVILTSRNRVHT